MEDPGYDSYQDPRLQPPDEPEDTPRDAYESCIHANACLTQHKRCKPVYGEPWDALGCYDCMEWRSYDDCPMRKSGIMRCEGRCR